MNLYEISSELARINDTLIESGGELSEDLEKLLDSCTLDFNAKVENISKWVRNLESREEALSQEIRRLNARKESAKNYQERLKAYMKACMEQAGKTKIEFSTLTISLQKNPPSCNIKDETMVPARFITIVPEQKVVDKKAVLNALKAGEIIEGAEYINDKTHLRIK